jgi:hypothetical protein
VSVLEFNMNISKVRLMVLTIILSSTVISANVFANPNRGDNKKPPKEAIEACVDKNEGDSVTFTTRHGHTLTGVCTTMNDLFVAVPENPPSREENN